MLLSKILSVAAMGTSIYAVLSNKKKLDHVSTSNVERDVILDGNTGGDQNDRNELEIVSNGSTTTDNTTLAVDTEAKTEDGSTNEERNVEVASKPLSDRLREQYPSSLFNECVYVLEKLGENTNVSSYPNIINQIKNDLYGDDVDDVDNTQRFSEFILCMTQSLENSINVHAIKVDIDESAPTRLTLDREVMVGYSSKPRRDYTGIPNNRPLTLDSTKKNLSLVKGNKTWRLSSSKVINISDSGWAILSSGSIITISELTEPLLLIIRPSADGSVTLFGNTISLIANRNTSIYLYTDGYDDESIHVVKERDVLLNEVKEKLNVIRDQVIDSEYDFSNLERIGVPAFSDHSVAANTAANALRNARDFSNGLNINGDLVLRGTIKFFREGERRHIAKESLAFNTIIYSGNARSPFKTYKAEISLVKGIEGQGDSGIAVYGSYRYNSGTATPGFGKAHIGPISTGLQRPGKTGNVTHGNDSTISNGEVIINLTDNTSIQASYLGTVLYQYGNVWTGSVYQGIPLVVAQLSRGDTLIISYDTYSTTYVAKEDEKIYVFPHVNYYYAARQYINSYFETNKRNMFTGVSRT